MSVGFIMLVHTALDRAAETARHWATSGCPVVIHADRRVARAEYDGLRQALADLEAVRFVEPRHRCEWGTWGIVGATVAACEQMLAQFPGLGHVYLASGSCLPLRPMPELAAYLGARPGTDFIESVRIEDVGWCKGGFDKERFTLRFPFSYRRHRLLFDRFVEVQRGLGLTRAVPEPLEPHLGSQWWCLSVPTLTAILQDPRRPAFERYFRRVWIPDESYFQTMVRLHGRRVESRSLTLSKFDFQGRPHVFYDDHLQLLRRSDCFVARKIWPRADRLYRSFLSNDPGVTKNAEPNPGKIDRLFAKAADLRRHGRPGLRMQSRFPSPSRESAPTAAPYTVLEGFSELFVDFEDWLGRITGLRVHGHLFAPERARFAGGERVYNGALSDAPALRDYDPRAFLSNLVWATRGEHQCFMFGPGDRQEVARLLAADPNAITGVIERLRSLGLRIALDDFGTGYSSMARLAELKPSALKIDGQFVRDHRGDGDRIIRSILGLAKAFGLHATAEFVETDEQREYLRGLGCDALQGYGIAEPMPEEKLFAWVEARALSVRP